MSYIPPHLRNKEVQVTARRTGKKEPQPQPLPVLDLFPSLDNTPTPKKKKLPCAPPVLSGWSNITKSAMDKEKKVEEDKLKLEEERLKSSKQKNDESKNEKPLLVMMGPTLRVKSHVITKERDVPLDENYCTDVVIPRDKDVVIHDDGGDEEEEYEAETGGREADAGYGTKVWY